MKARGRTKSKAAGYPRDMVGYGKPLPDPKWPGQARLALQISLNHEAGGELEREISSWDALRFARLCNGHCMGVRMASRAGAGRIFTERSVVADNGVPQRVNFGSARMSSRKAA
jgi:hypothetical protein